MNNPPEMSGWTCSPEVLSIARCCWGLWKGTHSMAGNCNTEELCHLAPPEAEHISMLVVPAGGEPVPTSSWYWAVSPCKTWQMLLPPTFMEIEKSILTSSSSQLLPGNSKVRLCDLLLSCLPNDLHCGSAASLVPSPFLLCGQSESCFEKLGFFWSVRTLSQSLLFIRWEL